MSEAEAPPGAEGSSGERRAEGSGAEDAGTPDQPRGGAAKVAAGVLLSRILGFVREGAFARYLGVGPY